MFERRRKKNVSLQIRRVCRDVCESKSTRLARRGSPYFREIRGTSCRSRVTSLQRLSSQRRRPLSDSTSVPRTENERLSLTLDGTLMRVYKQRENSPLNRWMLSRMRKKISNFQRFIYSDHGSAGPRDYNSNFRTRDYHIVVSRKAL